MIRGIKTWLLRVVHGWARRLEDSTSLEVVYDGAIRTVDGIQAVGIRIQCMVPGEHHALYLFGEWDAVDRRHFWRLWRRLGGQDLKWEDGTTFRPDSEK